MFESLLNDWRSGARPVSGTKIMRNGVFALMFLGIVLSHSAPAQAVPIKNPENCKGPVTIGVATCPDKPGHWVECNPAGDYMCCVGNAQGGKDCEQITTLTNPKGGSVRVPGGVLQNAPVASPPSSTPRFPKAGMNAPIMRRGVEGEQPAEPAPDSTGPSEQSSETKK